MTAFTNEELITLLKHKDYDNFIYVVKQMKKDDIIKLIEDLLVK